MTKAVSPDSATPNMKPGEAIYLALVCRALNGYEMNHPVQKSLRGITLTNIKQPDHTHYQCNVRTLDELTDDEYDSANGEINAFEALLRTKEKIHFDRGFFICNSEHSSTFADDDDYQIELFYDASADAIYVFRDPHYSNKCDEPRVALKLDIDNYDKLKTLVDAIDLCCRPARYAPVDVLLMGLQTSFKPMWLPLLGVLLCCKPNLSCGARVVAGVCSLPLVPILLGIAVPLTAIGLGVTITASLAMLVIDIFIVKPISLFMCCCATEKGMDALDEKLMALAPRTTTPPTQHDELLKPLLLTARA